MIELVFRLLFLCVLKSIFRDSRQKTDWTFESRPSYCVMQAEQEENQFNDINK